MDEDAALGIARFVESLLLTKYSSIAASLMNSLLIEALRERGLATKTGSTRNPELAYYLTQKLFSRSTDNRSAKVHSFVRQIQRAIHDPASGLVTGRLALLYCLFGSFDFFHQKLKWLAVIQSGSATGPICNVDCQGIVDVQAMHRSRCLMFISENQGCSRLDFTRAEYRSFRWLLHNDAAWLAHYLPIPSQRARQSEMLF